MALPIQGIQSVVYEIGPDLIEFASKSRDTRQIRRTVAHDLDAVLPLEPQDGQGGFEGGLHVYLLLRRLIHVGVTFDRVDHLRNTSGALLHRSH